VVMGLEFNHDQGAVFVMKHLYRNGIWAIFSTLDKRVLQFKPGILIDRELCDEILTRLDTAVAEAQAELFGGRALRREAA
jgi:acetylornithine/succinyldiaminopimelate/putrescine aminotransferase